MTICRFLLPVLALMLAAAPSAQSREFALVSIDPGNAEGLQRIADMGIDIWDALGGRVTAAATTDDLDRLKKAGFTWTILYATRGALESSMPRATGPLEEDYRETTPEELENLKNLPYIGG